MLEHPSDGGDHPQDDPTRTLHQGPGERLGPGEFVRPTDDAFPGYRILGQLSSGGQGIVYRAIQESTTRRVAVKVLLEGIYASRSAQKRFEREIELVAQLAHPNIISVFDSGTTKDGRRFYVMDYVQGRPLNRHIWRQDLSLEEALELFGLVCEAVEYAHQKGVIHRDLKPSNILVDHHGAPKVLDFGLAKSIDTPAGTPNSASSADTLISASYNLIGTLPYMSPEQVRGKTQYVDARTDVYSLGVVLYELLTGRYPYPQSDEWSKFTRHILETPPLPPARQWTQDRGIARRSGRRHRSENCPIDAEVQTIVLKSLAKECERRYQTAGDLAGDIRSYLAGEPISARADSQWYVLRKKITRHRTGVMSSAVIVAVLAVASLVTLQYRSQVAAERARSMQAATESRQRHAEQSFQTAHTEFLRGNYNNALRLVSDGLGLVPDNRSAKLLRARVEARTETLEVAVADIESLLGSSEAWSPVERGELHVLLASLYAQQENDHLFQQHIAEAQRLLPSPADLHYARALTAVLPSDRRAYLDEALAADPDHFDSLMYRAYTNLQQVNLEDALFDAERAALLRPLDDETHLVVAMILYSQGHIGRAYDRFRGYDSQRLNSTLLFRVMAWTDVHGSKERSPQERASLEREIQLLTEALERQPADGLGYIGRGAILLNLGRLADAARDFDRAIALGEVRGYAWRVIARRGSITQLTSRQNLEDIDHLIAHGFAAFLFEKGYLFMFRGESQKALAAYDAALDLDSRNFMAHLAKPWVRYHCWRTGLAPSSLDDIRADFDAAIDCDSWGSAVLANAMTDMIRTQVGWFQVDYPFAEAARYVEAPSAQTWRILGQALLKDIARPVDERQALAFFNQRLAFDADDSDGLAGLARLHLDSADRTIRDVSKAVELAERAVKLGPGFGLYRRLLGRAYLAAGDPQSAAGQLDRALEANGENEWDLLLRALARNRAGLLGPAQADLALAEELLAEIEDDTDADLDQLHRQVVLETTIQPDGQTQPPGAARARG